MKTLSIKLTEPLYEAVEAYARRHNQSPEEVVAEMVKQWQSPKRPRTFSSLPPADLGRMTPPDRDDDLLEEMRSDTRY